MLAASADPVLVLAIVAGSFLLGGIAKGASGIGLPLVAMPILANVMAVPTAIALLAVPVMATNLYQFALTGHAVETTRRFGGMAASLMAGSALGALLLVAADQDVLSVFLGMVLLAVAASTLLPSPRVLRPTGEAWVGVPIGFAAGFVGGTSSLFGPLVVAFLVALKLDKNRFVAAVSFVFLAGTIPLNTVLVTRGVLGWEEAALSLAGCLPTFIGLWAGRRLLTVMSPATFQRFIIILVAVMGASLVLRGLA